MRRSDFFIHLFKQLGYLVISFSTRLFRFFPCFTPRKISATAKLIMPIAPKEPGPMIQPISSISARTFSSAVASGIFVPSSPRYTSDMLSTLIMVTPDGISLKNSIHNRNRFISFFLQKAIYSKLSHALFQNSIGSWKKSKIYLSASGTKKSLCQKAKAPLFLHFPPAVQRFGKGYFINIFQIPANGNAVGNPRCFNAHRL